LKRREPSSSVRQKPNAWQVRLYKAQDYRWLRVVLLQKSGRMSQVATTTPKQYSTGNVPNRSHATLETRLGKTQPKRQHLMGTNQPIVTKMVALSSYLPSLSRSAPMRHDLRQEPSALNTPARIREGGNPQGLSLPRHHL